MSDLLKTRIAAADLSAGSCIVVDGETAFVAWVIASKACRNNVVVILENGTRFEWKKNKKITALVQN